MNKNIFKNGTYSNKLLIFQFLFFLFANFVSVFILIGRISKECYSELWEEETMNYATIIVETLLFSPFYFQIF